VRPATRLAILGAAALALSILGYAAFRSSHSPHAMPPLPLRPELTGPASIPSSNERAEPEPSHDPQTPTSVAAGPAETPAPILPPLVRLGLPEHAAASLESIALLAFKEEQHLELWIRPPESKWRLHKQYPFTAFSGTLGPKLREGDKQIPEGIYRIEYLNPNSSYHLSLKIDYPNAFDRQMARRDGRTRLGGDIFLHGEDVTIGCIPLGNEAIEEVFALVATAGKEKATVLIAPRDLRKSVSPPVLPDIPWTQTLYRDLQSALGPFGRSTDGRP